MHNVWAVATNTVKQAVRMRLAVVFVLLLMLLIPVMGFSVTGDGTLKGRLQTFVSYSLSLTSFLLCLLTIAVSIYSLTSDISEKQIYTVITKPIRRFELLFGKLLGVILLNTGLLVFFSALIYGITVYTPSVGKTSKNELRQAENEFFTARAGLVPAEPDVSGEVRTAFDKLAQEGRLPELFRGLSRKEIFARLTKQAKLRSRAANVGQELIWEFDNVKPLDPNQSLFIRFKYDVSVTPPDLQIYGRWWAGDIRQVRYGQPIVTGFYEFENKDLIRTSHEIEVPADVIAPDGYLAVGFLNPPLNQTVVIFPLEGGLEVLYKADTFTANFIRAVLLVLLRLIILAALGVLASTFLSFPVALLLCMVIFFTANFSGFVLESFDYLSENISSIYKYTLRPIIHLLPQFDKYNPTKYLVGARLLGWPVLAKAAALMVLVKAVLLMLLAIIVFSRREIAKITV
ncbi:MAG TPA: ABC transporter permease [Sedimentisphaerales bacterium]|nr:ABC transporter permease [Sedimentisphaerales bacterium]